MAEPRILFVQYTNPGGYPPLEHAARLLEAAGWRVRFLGTGADGAEDLALEGGSRVEVRAWRRWAPGLGQKLHYTAFTLWTLGHALAWRPAALYASDPLAAVPALLIRLVAGTPIVYHEHDAPGAAARTIFWRAVLAARRRLLKRVAVAVVPGDGRADLLREAGAGVPLVVWNVPLREEVADQPAASGPVTPLVLYFHGSIVPDRIPLSVVDAVARFGGRVVLRIVGYETAGHRGHAAALQERARAAGAAETVHVLPAVPRRAALAECRAAHVGLSLVPLATDEPNLATLVGPSNKPFDYLACGLPLLVPNRPEWVTTFVDRSLALACDPEDSTSVERALRWFLEHPAERHAMGLRGQALVRESWNYDTQFRPVLEALEAMCSV